MPLGTGQEKNLIQNKPTKPKQKIEHPRLKWIKSPTKKHSIKQRPEIRNGTKMHTRLLHNNDPANESFCYCSVHCHWFPPFPNPVILVNTGRATSTVCKYRQSTDLSIIYRVQQGTLPSPINILSLSFCHHSLCCKQPPNGRPERKGKKKKKAGAAAYNNGSISSVITQTSALFKEAPC